MSIENLRERNLTPSRIALLYLAFGFVALFASDVLLLLVFEDPLLRALQAAKGGIEILVTAAFIYLLVRWSWRDLRRKERAIDAAPIGITMSNPDRADNPLVFLNRRFEELTGYDESDVLGRNCRILQGADTEPEARTELREAIDEERPVSVDIVNYRENGGRFWNKVDVAPVRNADGDVTNFVGFQADITDRKIREERLTVLNRVLRHNFRNKMNVIDGYVDVLRDHFDGEAPTALARIDSATRELVSLTETVRRTEAILEGTESTDAPVRLDERVRETVSAFRDRYPAATLELALPDTEPLEVRAPGLLAAIEEGVENAIKHNDGPEPTVEVRVETRPDGWVTIDIEDDGPGIPEPEVEVLSEGERPLQHAERLGIWSIYWTVVRAGGSLEISEAADGGSVLSLSVPGVAA